MDEPRTAQKLAAEVIGTAFLVFIGVGSVPATLIVNGDAPFTMADLGMISLAFGTIVVATVYALGHIGGNHINPAVTLGLAVTGKFPWTQVPAYIDGPGRGSDHRRSSHPRRPRPEGQRRRTRGGVVRRQDQRGPGLHGRVRRHVHPRVHDLRRDPPQGGRRLRRCRDRPGRLRRHHPGGTDDRRVHQPGAHLRPHARAADRRRHRAVGAAARLPDRRAPGGRRRCPRLRGPVPDPRRQRDRPRPDGGAGPRVRPGRSGGAPT